MILLETGELKGVVLHHLTLLVEKLVEYGSQPPIVETNRYKSVINSTHNNLCGKIETLAQNQSNQIKQ